MKQKTFAFCLSVLLLIVQNTFIFAQKTSANEDLAVLLGDSDVILVADVKKILGEMMPNLLNNEASAIEKIRASMSLLETETGVNPYTLERIAFGIKFAPGSQTIILQTNGSAAALAESMYQNQTAKAKIDVELNPLRQQIYNVKTKVETFSVFDSGIKEISSDFAYFRDKSLKTGEALLKLPKTAANGKLIEGMFSDLENTNKIVEKLEKEFTEKTKTNEISERLQALLTQSEGIKYDDPQRAAKVAEIEKNFKTIAATFEKIEVLAKNYEAEMTVGKNSLRSVSTLEEVDEIIKKLPAAEPRRSQSLRSAQKALADLKAGVTVLDTEIHKPSTTVLPKDEENYGAEIYPDSITISRRDGNFDGKKMVVAIKESKSDKSKSDSETRKEETAMIVLDDKTLLISDEKNLTSDFADKSNNRNAHLKNLLAKSSDAPLSFGLDLRNVDVNEVSAILGEQKNIWQIYGSMNGANNDLVLNVSIEKTDIPLPDSPKKMEVGKISSLPKELNKDAVVDLMSLMFKSISGLEGKITVHFEKKKAALLIEDSTKFLQKALGK